MRIAVTYLNGQVAPAFENTASFKLYETEGSEITRDVIVPAFGSGYEALADCLKDYGANVVICCALAGKARVALTDAGIVPCAGVIGDSDSVVRGFLSGTVRDNADLKAANACSGKCESCRSGCHPNSENHAHEHTNS